VATVLHYSGAFPGNALTWAAWIPAVAAYIGSFRIGLDLRWEGFRAFLLSEPGIAALVAALYVPTHLWNYGSAPWNNFGIFDDAAWDVYFARTHAFTGPFQAAFYDDVGAISRETIFHYYITIFFRLFGANLQVFNLALLVLGLLTVVFTTLVVHRLFRKPLVTALAALMINFLPLHYLHVYVGHRYAIAAPLMMAALYFAYSAFQDRSYARAGLSALVAALCFGSAIMGKQFIIAFAVAGALVPFLERRRWREPETRGLWLAWIVAFLIAAIPLLTYIAFNREDYFRRDSGLLSDFLAVFAASGYAGVQPYFQGIFDLFFAGDTFSRLWLHDYPLVPLAYWILLIPGAVLALLRGRIELLLLAIIPVGSAFLAGPTDFRVLLAAPIWIVLMAYTLDAVLPRGLPATSTSGRNRPEALAVAGLAIAIVLAGVLPSGAYLWRVSTDPHAQYLLRHRDVAVSRIFQDVIAGDQPSPELKGDEFARPLTTAAQHTDALVCPEQAYAVAHLYLQSFGDRAALAFCDDGNQALLGPDGVLAANLRALGAYQPSGRDLVLMWEQSDLARPAIEAFAPFERFGAGRSYDGTIDGEPYSVRVLTIPAAQVTAFREAVLEANPMAAS
jgi:Dolichyl-phosphate-mannose-protein mannosyltransferase